MKRIIIPAGTVSGKQDYILEIPIDSNDQDENAIYILDDKSSKGSLKSLSDYFYDKDSRTQLNQEYMKQYLYQQDQEEDPQNYQNQLSDDMRYSYPQNYMVKQEFKSVPYQQAENPNLPDISESAKYYYYKSLGFTESELHKLLDKNTGQRRVARVPSQRKQMKFNRLGVSDLTVLDDNQNPNTYQKDSYSKRMSWPTNVGNYANVMTDATYQNMQYNPSNSYENAQDYYDDYYREPQSDVPQMEARMYQQYSVPRRSPVTPKRSNITRANQSYSAHQTPNPSAGNNQMQNVYYPVRNYPKTPSSNAASTSKIESSNDAAQKSQSVVPNMVRAVSPNRNAITNARMENYQKTLQNIPKKISDPQKGIYRTLPGTSVVSNVPNIRLRSTVTS